jgi:hypothetical protein
MRLFILCFVVLQLLAASNSTGEENVGKSAVPYYPSPPNQVVPPPRAVPPPRQPDTTNTVPFSVGPVGRPIQRFQYPTTNDDSGREYRLDWCYEWSARCGQAAADAFCQAHGRNRAASFEKQDGVAPTWVPLAHRYCKQGRCDGFSFIDCAD